MLDLLKELEYDWYALVDLIVEYNNYVMKYPEDHDVRGGNYPVCLEEFYDNEYQEILENRKIRVDEDEEGGF